MLDAFVQLKAPSCPVLTDPVLAGIVIAVDLDKTFVLHILLFTHRKHSAFLCFYVYLVTLILKYVTCIWCTRTTYTLNMVCLLKHGFVVPI